jgi:hypothetical protein
MKTLGIIWQFILAHELITAYVVAVLIDNLPPPGANPFYRYFFGVIQIFAANLTRAKLGVQGALAKSGNALAQGNNP